jgi:hypothetical protein
LKKIHTWLEAGGSAWDFQSLTELYSCLISLDALWHTHITLEEEHLGPQSSERWLTPEENAQLAGQLSTHGQQHAVPNELVVPFVLYNLPVEDRAVMIQTFPPVVSQQLIPIAWKKTWAPMQPFLLE